MSVFSTKQLVDRASEMDRDKLLAVVTRIVNLPVSPTMRSNFAKIIMGEEETEVKELAYVSKNKAITKRALMILSESPMMSYLTELVSAALDPRGPFATRDIMLLAAEKKKEKAFFITKDGISQSYKNQVGLILNMAGFERVSHYDRHTKKPIKAWKSIMGWGTLGVEERVTEVQNIIQRELGSIEIHKLPKLEDFL